MWIVWHFNFTKLISTPCKKSNYETWQEKGGACVLGQHISSQRRKPTDRCINGPTFDNAMKKIPCKCTYKDYYCDRDYLLVKSGKCIPVNPHYQPPCIEGKLYNKTKGYLKHFGDKCRGGIEEKVKPVLTKCVYDKAELKFSASSTQVSVGEVVQFKIVTMLGIHNATFTWLFPPKITYTGTYDKMKKVSYKFTTKGTWHVSLRAEWANGRRHVNRVMQVQVLDALSVDPHIVYASPLLRNKPANFTLKTFTKDGKPEMMRKPDNTKVLWSFNGDYTTKDDLVTLMYTFPKPGPVNVEVQIISSVSTLTPLREQLTVYHSAVFVDITFSKDIDKVNPETDAWIMSLEGSYWNYLNTKFELRDKGLKDRVYVRGRARKPTKLTIIVCNTEESAGKPNVGASSIAKNIATVLEKEKPSVKIFEGESVDIHVEHARIVSDDKGGEGIEKEHAWVYILLVMVLLGAVVALTAYYRYRRKGTLLCMYPHDNMNTQLVEDEDDDFVDPNDHNVVYRDL